MQLIKKTLTHKPMTIAEISKLVNLLIARVQEIINSMWDIDEVAQSENEKGEESWVKDSD
jgi:predicted transcriptional regulator